MNLNKLWVATALTVAAVSAQATVVVSTTGATTSYTENFNGGSSFSAGYVNAPFITDNYMTLTSPLGASSSSYSFTALSAIQSLALSFNYAASSSLASWSLVGPAQTLSKTGNLLAVALSNPGAGAAQASFATSWNNLAAGTYTLTFNRAPGVSIFKVDDVNILVTAVPEPETYALMLAGLMMVGTIARRRSRSK